MIFTALPQLAFAQSNEAELESEGVRVWQMLPRPSEMIRHPGAEGWEFYGAQAELVDVDRLPGGKTQIVDIKSGGKNPWDIGANAKTQVKTNAGDVILGAFWARAAQLPEGKSETRLPIHLQQQGEPYVQFKSSEAVLTSAWHQYFIYKEMPKKMKKGALGIAVHLANDVQVIELGPVYIMNLGQGAIDPAAMPKSTYLGKGASLNKAFKEAG